MRSAASSSTTSALGAGACIRRPRCYSDRQRSSLRLWRRARRRRSGTPSQVGELWTELSHTLARLDALAAAPDRLDDVRAEARCAGSSTRCTSRASTPTGWRRRPGAEPAHAELADALAGARDATARGRRGARRPGRRGRRAAAARVARRALPRAARPASPRRARGPRATLGEVRTTASRARSSRSCSRSSARSRSSPARRSGSGRSGRPGCSPSARRSSRTGRNPSPAARPFHFRNGNAARRTPRAPAAGPSSAACRPCSSGSGPGARSSARSTRSRRRSRSGRRAPLQR